MIMKSSEYIEIEEKYGAHNYHPLDVVLSKGEGVWVTDVDGNKYGLLKRVFRTQPGACPSASLESINQTS
jgi:acetylornithine/succinyldiaminopimelate/putrescine aminotransferase